MMRSYSWLFAIFMVMALTGINGVPGADRSPFKFVGHSVLGSLCHNDDMISSATLKQEASTKTKKKRMFWQHQKEQEETEPEKEEDKQDEKKKRRWGLKPSEPDSNKDKKRDNKKEDASNKAEPEKPPVEEAAPEKEDEKKDETKDDAPTQEKPEPKPSEPSRPVFIYRTVPSTTSKSPSQFRRPAGVGSSGPSPQNQALMVAAALNIVSLASRFLLIKWIVAKLGFESEMKNPVQHYMWECLNDKFTKDNEIWKSVLSRPAMGFSKMKWNRIVKNMGPSKQPKKEQPKEEPGPSRAVVVLELNTFHIEEPNFEKFTEVVSFLVGANSPRKKFFGSEPEVILILESPGGEVTTFGLAAAQVARLRSSGWTVTACVDRIAASGGYMIASQANQIVAAPFAQVGSIGVTSSVLNYYNILKQYGIQSLVQKAGDMKNPLTPFGDVSDRDLKINQEELEKMHLDFIDLCRVTRPILDSAVCNGRILRGESALEFGMIDRIATSEDYIVEKITDGDLVMKLHLVHPSNERNMFAQVLQLLPHMGKKQRSVSTRLVGNSASGSPLENVDSATLIKGIAQGMILLSMISRAVQRAGSTKKN